MTTTAKQVGGTTQQVARFIGSLTQQETARALKELVHQLPDDLLIETLSECLTMAQIDELQERLP